MEVSRKYNRSPEGFERSSLSPPARRRPTRRESPIQKSSSPDEPSHNFPTKHRSRKRLSTPDGHADFPENRHHRTRRSSDGRSRKHHSSRESPGRRSRSPRPRRTVRSRSHSGSSESRSDSQSPDGDDGARLHVADLGMGITKNDLKTVYEKFGPIQEIWVAKSPPCFAFIVFLLKDDAEDALKSTDGMTLCGSRVRVTFARPRTRGRNSRGFDPNMRCYQCGEKGHFSRDCPDTKYGYKRPPSRSPSRRAHVAGNEMHSSHSRRHRQNGRRYN